MKGIKVINKFQTSTDDTYTMKEKITNKLVKIIKIENKDIFIKI